MTEVISKLPALNVTWKLRSEQSSERDLSGDAQEVGGAGQGGVVRGQRWVDVGVAEECVVVMEITRNSQGKVQYNDCAVRYLRHLSNGHFLLVSGLKDFH